MASMLQKLLLIAALAAVWGCASGDPDRESDIPWNEPQGWESAPGIPGLDNNR